MFFIGNSTWRKGAVILCILILCNCTSSQENKTPEQFGQSIINTFTHNDPDRYAEYLLREDQFNELLEQSDIPAEHKKIIAVNGPKKIKRLHKDAAKQFNAVRKKGERDGADWSKAKFVNVELRRTDEKPDVWQKRFDIVFTSADLYFKIRLDNCLKTDNGWFLAGPPKWVKMHGYIHADWDNMLVFHLDGAAAAEDLNKARLELLKSPHITGITFFSQIPHLNEQSVRLSVGDTPQGEGREVKLLQVDPRFFNDVGMRLISGRPFISTTRDEKTGSFIVNQKLCSLMQWNDPLGKKISLTLAPEDVLEGRIVGVVMDTMREYTPATIYRLKLSGEGCLAFRVPLPGRTQALEAIRSSENLKTLIKDFTPIQVDLDFRKKMASRYRQKQ